jgi:hypothetical protein
MKKSMLAVVLIAGLLTVGCGEQKKTAMLAPSPVAVATASGISADGLASAFELGSTYQMMGTLGFDSLEFDPGSNGETSLNLGFAYYWKPVDNNDTPIGLQEFMQKATKAFANLWFLSPDGGNDSTAWEVGGNYGFLENKLIAEASLNGKYGFGDIVVTGEDMFGFQVGAKYYILDTLTAGLAYASTTDSSGPTDEDITQVIINGEYAIELGGRWLDAGLMLDFMDGYGSKTTTIGVEATYYVLKELGVNVMFANTSGDADANSFGIGAKYYYGPLAAGVAYRSVSEDGGFDISDFGFTVEYRF